MAYSLRSGNRSSSQTPAGEKEPLTFHTASEALLTQGRERGSPKEKSARVDDGPTMPASSGAPGLPLPTTVLSLDEKLEKMMSMMQKMVVKEDLANLERKLGHMDTEIEAIKANAVCKADFQNLVSRMDKLEADVTTIQTGTTPTAMETGTTAADTDGHNLALVIGNLDGFY